MKKLFLFLLAGLPFTVHGQVVPLWVDEMYREHNFPSDEWYTGFAHDHLKPGANSAAALRVLERDAQNQLAESIIVTIDGSTQMRNASSQRSSGGQRSEVTATEYRQAVMTATSATVVKTDVKSFHDSSTGELYAFAAVRRSDLATFYTNRIAEDLNKAATTIEVSGQLAAAGKKLSARRKAEEAKPILDNVSYYRDLLIAVDSGADESGLQSSRDKELRRTVEQLLIDLEQSTFVYMDTAGDQFGIFSDIMAQALSENGCSIVESRDEADYELTLTASAAMRSGGTVISYYANVKGSLLNRLTDKRVAEFSILNDPDSYSVGRSAEDAISKAFRRPALKDKILEKILTKINN